MMKKLLVGLLFLSIFLTGCSFREGSEKNSSNSSYPLEDYQVVSQEEKGDFIYRLATRKDEYSEGEAVYIIAALEYIGEMDSIKIYHAASPFYFPMTETTRNYKIDYAMNMPLLSTTISRGEPIFKEYKGSGGFSEQDDPSYIEFIKAVWEKKFPTGDYIVDGYATFSLTDKLEDQVILKNQIRFKVK